LLPLDGSTANRRRRSTLFAVQTQGTRIAASIAALILLATLFRLDGRKLTRADVMAARAFHEQLGIPSVAL